MQLYQPMPVMIWIAIVIEAAIENWLDMGILLAIQVRFVSGCWETGVGEGKTFIGDALNRERTFF